MSYEIGAFSELVSLSIDTLRYYEKLGLIKPQRSTNNRRAYTDNDIKWVQFIKRLKKTGMPIKSIKLYAKLRYQGNATIDERLKLLDNQMHRLKTDQNEIQAHIAFLNQKMATYRQIKAEISKTQ
ncbi:MerR family transcriptional regulator [Lentilactobacillus kisonensis]|uniref:Transcriptional regulator, MerR family n=2 Tax=Lentilactobacillus kisonensis TaxID=481722 RepID=H1LIB6_9LACO|nr:MerR family transcriptional regulator [Lentilactobacillus kisonensis]EHO49869.1 transcriptional regulator, MerR family [Lentilactobacillus kisonensis F0435]KRL20141.1 transcriptional regulator, MerR family [Lentilactobacillus kisonensis DSM 19906 = JCM 15041]